VNVFRAVLTRDFWITGIAIARYVPRAFRLKQVDGNQIFNRGEAARVSPARGKCDTQLSASVGSRIRSTELFVRINNRPIVNRPSLPGVTAPCCSGRSVHSLRRGGSQIEST
jgi:hypothetical protein